MANADRWRAMSRDNRVHAWRLGCRESIEHEELGGYRLGRPNTARPSPRGPDDPARILLKYRSIGRSSRPIAHWEMV
jgi:hypothetical protein